MSSDMALYEANREIESQRLDLYQANQWVDQAQRKKWILAESWTWKKTNYSKKVAQEIAKNLKKLRRICLQKTDRASKLGTDDIVLCTWRGIQLLGVGFSTQIQELQNRVPCPDIREFYGPETACSSAASPRFSADLRFLVAEECEAAILDCLVVHGILGVLQETFFWKLAREGPSLAIENSRNLASYSCGDYRKQSATSDYRKFHGTWERSETRAAEMFNTNSSF